LSIGQQALVTPFTVSTTSVNVVDLRPTRAMVVIYNVTGTLYIKYGLNASSTSFTESLAAGELTKIMNYSGPMSVIKASGSSQVYVTDVW